MVKGLEHLLVNPGVLGGVETRDMLARIREVGDIQSWRQFDGIMTISDTQWQYLMTPRCHWPAIGRRGPILGTRPDIRPMMMPPKCLSIYRPILAQQLYIDLPLLSWCRSLGRRAVQVVVPGSRADGDGGGRGGSDVQAQGRGLGGTGARGSGALQRC